MEQERMLIHQSRLVESSFQNSNISAHIDTQNDIKLLGFSNEYSQMLLNLLSNTKESILARNQPLPGRDPGAD